MQALSPIPAHKQEGEEWSGEGINAQKLSILGPGDLLPEDESPSHWALKMNGAGHQGYLERVWAGQGRGGQVSSLVEDQCTPRPNTEAAV